MALNASKYPPKSTTDLLTGGELLPVPLKAQPGDPAVNIFVGDREWNSKEHVSEPSQEPQNVTIVIGDDNQNLVDLITSLTARIEALETP